MAGDMTDFANRGKVALVRQGKGGEMIHYLDLNKSNILNSEYYYLMPNDIIYISPLPIKRYGFTQFPYGTVLGVITTFSTIILLIYTLKK